MTYLFNRGEVYHQVGPVTLGILRDVGWTVNTTPAPIYEPGLAITPTSAEAGHRFTITGSGFVPGETVALWLTTPTGARSDGPAKTADSQGQLSTWWDHTSDPIMGDPLGQYTVYARGNQSQKTVTATFTVTTAPAPIYEPGLAITPTSAEAGHRFTITGSGFVPGETVALWLTTPTGARSDGSAKTADSQGQLSTWWDHISDPIMGEPLGQYTVYARGNQSQKTVTATFTVTTASSSNKATSQVYVPLIVHSALKQP
jgi:hypothetical protein